MLEIGRFYAVETLIDIVKNKADRKFDNNNREMYDRPLLYNIYIAEGADLETGIDVYVGKTLEVDENDNEIYPEDVQKLCLEFCYACQTFQDVIDLEYKQKTSATYAEVIKCLNYYSEKDDFFDL